jgi:hypothetical protein
MAPPGNPVLYILTVIFVCIVALFGMFAMFVRAENIERNFLVGGLTILTAVIAGIMLAELPVASQTGPILTSIALVSLFGYGIGRLIDYLMGPTVERTDPTQPTTLGADLSD